LLNTKKKSPRRRRLSNQKARKIYYAFIDTARQWAVTSIFAQMERILFVCLGNICRSPLAEAVFKHRVNLLGLSDAFEVDSCGTADYHIGSQPDPRTVKNALKNGVPIDHACRQLCEQDFERFDRIFVMDEHNYRNTLRLAPADHHHKVKLMRTFDPLGKDQSVPDPYYGVEKDFQEVFDILDRTITAFLTSGKDPKRS
jgi:protein-tyrosine phosphatase